MPKYRSGIGMSVFDAALDRLVPLYEEGHRIVVSVSGGKDSTVALEVAVVAATLTNRLPVEVMMRDDEIMYPGTFEYLERMAARPEIDFNWFCACQPCANVYNRKNPFFWTFDDRMNPEDWVRQPPDFAQWLPPNTTMTNVTIPERFPPPEDKTLYAVIGLKVTESRARMYGLYSSGSHITKPNHAGVRNVRPIYDWHDGDVWKAIQDNKWDYNSAYNVMYRAGYSGGDLRIGQPLLNVAGAHMVRLSSKAWPKWFDKVHKRCPGVRSVVTFGADTLRPRRAKGETWEEVFHRTCLNNAPEWIIPRAQRVMEFYMSIHSRHATFPFPDVSPCKTCAGGQGSWKQLTTHMYNGDPDSMRFGGIVPLVQPEQFRPGAGNWSKGKAM